jgi:YbbR domain-containing protein
MPQVLRWLVGDLPLKVVALLLAFFLWVVAVLDRTYDVQLTVPVAVIQDDARRIIADVDARTAVVTVEGRGRDLVTVRPARLGFRLEIPDGKLGNREVQLSPADLRLPASVTVRTVAPEKVELKVTAAASRVVTVQVPTTGQAPGGVNVSINQPPAQVRLHGPDEELKLVSALYTDTLNLAGVTEPGTRRMRVLLPAGGPFSADPESVDVAIGLEREGARIFLGVPVKVVAPNARSVDIDPTEAQIAVAGPASKINQIRITDVVAQIKISGLGPGDYQLAAEITLPPDFHLVKCEPQLFDVTVK